MDRRAFLSTLAGGLLAAPISAEAQAAGKVPRMGWLVADLAAKSQMTEAFLAAELVALKVDVILTGGTAQALAAKTLGPTIPPPLLQRADRVIE